MKIYYFYADLVATIIFNVPAAEKRFLQDCTDDSTEHRPEDNTRVDNTHNHELLKDEDGDLILLRNAEERNDKELNILIGMLYFWCKPEF